MHAACEESVLESLQSLVHVERASEVILGVETPGERTMRFEERSEEKTVYWLH